MALVIATLSFLIASVGFYFQVLKRGTIWLSRVRRGQFGLTGPNHSDANLVIALGLTFHNSGARPRTIDDLTLILTRDGASLPQFRMQFVSDRMPIPKDAPIAGGLTIPAHGSQNWILGFVCEQPGVACEHGRYQARVEMLIDGNWSKGLSFYLPPFDIEELKHNTISWIGADNFEPVQ